MTLKIFEDAVILRLGPVPVTETMVTSVMVSLVLVGIAVLIRQMILTDQRHWLSTLGFLVVEAIDSQVKDIIGKDDSVVTAISGSLFLFIAGCNIAGQLPGAHPATANLAATSALATVVFFAVPILGIRERGAWAYFREYFKPNPLFLPLHLISEFSRTLALSVRLFGNVMSGHLVVTLLVALAGILVPTPMMALDLLIGVLQAYIFAVLSTVYVGAAIRTEEES